MNKGPGSSHRWDSIGGSWKLACALAILVGHNLVTLAAWRPDVKIWQAAYHLVQFFSPYHFFLFSGYFAASALLDRGRPMGSFMLGRALRIYVLVVAAFAWGLLARLAVSRISGTASLGSIWPLDTWDGPIDWRDALMHLSPIGFATHTKFNYAVWYLYQELRIVLLFPLFRWILHRPSSLARWSLAGLLMVAAALLEFKFWALFPLFRSSPFQTLAYGCYFLVGCLVAMELRNPRIESVPRWLALIVLVAGVAVSFLESMGIHPNVKNPPVLLLTILTGQVLVFCALKRLWGDVGTPTWWRTACEWSVGIYIVHPPIHMVAAWIAVSSDSAWPLLPEIILAIAAGAFFHRFVERPSQGWVKTLMGKSA